MNNGLLCSFCGKSDEDVEFLICGPSVYICDECVELCVKIIEDWRISKQRKDIEKIKFMEIWGTDL